MMVRSSGVTIFDGHSSYNGSIHSTVVPCLSSLIIHPTRLEMLTYPLEHVPYAATTISPSWGIHFLEVVGRGGGV